MAKDKVLKISWGSRGRHWQPRASTPVEVQGAILAMKGQHLYTSAGVKGARSADKSQHACRDPVEEEGEGGGAVCVWRRGGL